MLDLVDCKNSNFEKQIQVVAGAEVESGTMGLPVWHADHSAYV